MSRQPSALERRYIARNTLNCYLNFNVTATYNKPVTKAQVSQALRTIMLTNDNLLLNAFRKDPSDTMEDDRRENGHNWVIKLVQKVRYDDVVSVEKLEQDTQLDEDQIVAEYLSNISTRTCPLNTDTPPWRFVIYETDKKTYFTFYFDHTFFDGIVGAQFHEDFITQLDKQEAPEYVDVLYDQEKDGAPNLYLTYYQQQQLYSWPWYYPIINRIGQLKVVKWFLDFGSDSIPVHLVFQLSVSNRRKSTMLRGLELSIWTNWSFKKHHGSADVGGSHKAASVTDTHKYVTSTTAFPTFFGALDHLAKQQIVDIMKSHCERTLKEIKSWAAFRSQGMNMECRNFWDFFLAGVGLMNIPTSAVSNIGNHQFDSGLWKIENMWFSQGNGASFHFVFNAVSSHAGLNIVIGFLPEYEELMEGRLIKTFVKKFKKNVMGIVRQDRE
ncbi:hypothetical protein QFC19_000912 [Naganishia cerealis]|uniref:Uncharacterized protein n=1 Tax=Naganishia cerealis TaxID=610337 RepID=A0ACC2WLD7_9TREE|nr:hypothetical protein QFC19_000912 [Naganishia cerealis]